MRYRGILLGVFLFFALQASAQINSTENSLSLTTPSVAAASDTPAAVPSAPPESTELPAAASAARPASAPAAPQEVHGVFEEFPAEIYFGYTFFKLRETSNVSPNLNGFNFGMQYNFNKWISADGEFFAAFGSQNKVSGHFVFGGGGLRVRWQAPNGMEIWAHGLGGDSHVVPYLGKPSSQQSFAYELGGGVDVNFYRRRFAFRTSVDLVGSSYLNATQFSPKVSTGVVFKF